ncbi:hypothetical protein VTL71DRAFT_3131 [Oculimacula yallundae]|uniref:Putative transcription factor kapC n=1 Tax=Oculimacula yallundae TaxID=86028 RepID=A0ABR4C838_9HELO
MQSIAPAPAGPSQDSMNADNDLRAQLAAVINHTPGPHTYNDISHHSSSASPHDHNIDPAIGGSGGIMSNGGDSGGEDGDGRKGGKRELSQSKRAAQNRAAQRAFRQRKEGYIKKLEEQVRDLHNLEENYKAIQTENYSLREYIIHLQSRLIESQGDYPQPPPNVILNSPPRHEQHPEHIQQRHEAPVAPMAPMSQLQASTARTIAAASLQTGKHAQETREYEESKRYKSTSEDNVEQEIRTQLGGQMAM